MQISFLCRLLTNLMWLPLNWSKAINALTVLFALTEGNFLCKQNLNNNQFAEDEPAAAA